MDYTVEGQITHYAVWFGIYLGERLGNEPDSNLAETVYGVMDAEEVVSLMHEWATDFVASDEGDSVRFFENRLGTWFLQREEARK